MNKVILTGRLTTDPQVRYTAGENSTAVATFTLAVNRGYVKKDDPNAQTADFPICQCFGNTAQFVEKYFKKGQKADIIGRIQTGSYTNKEGQKVYTTDVVVENIEFGESKGSSNNTSVSNNNNTGYHNENQNNGRSFINIPENVNEELPFN